MAHQHGLVDGAGVVVQTAGDREVRHDLSGGAAGGLPHDLRKLREALLEQLVGLAEFTHALHEGGVLGADRGERERGPRLLRGGTHVLLEVAGHGVRADLLELVDLAQHGGGVGEAHGAVEALGELAVVHAQHERRDGQLGQRVHDDECQLHVVAERERAVPHHVDVRLRELPRAPLLGALAAPDLLDLVAAEREREVPTVLHHVAREGHGEVEVQGQGALGAGLVRILVQARDAVDLLVDLTLAQQLLHGLHRTGLDRGEAVQLEGPPQGVHHVLLHDPLLGEPLGETGQ